MKIDNKLFKGFKFIFLTLFSNVLKIHNVLIFCTRFILLLRNGSIFENFSLSSCWQQCKKERNRISAIWLDIPRGKLPYTVAEIKNVTGFRRYIYVGRAEITAWQPIPRAPFKRNDTDNYDKRIIISLHFYKFT